MSINRPQKNYRKDLVVSSLAWKELGSQNFFLTVSQSWKNWKLTNFLRCVGELRSQHKPLPLRLERTQGKYRESQLTGAELHEQKPLWEPEPGQENLNCSWQTAGAQCGHVSEVKPRGNKFQGGPHIFCEFYLQEPYQVFTEIWDKFPQAASKKQWKADTLKY